MRARRGVRINTSKTAVNIQRTLSYARAYTQTVAEAAAAAAAAAAMEAAVTAVTAAAAGCKGHSGSGLNSISPCAR